MKVETTHRTNGPGNCLRLSASDVWLSSSPMSTISSTAGWPSTGLFGRTWSKRPVGPNEALVCGMANLLGVMRWGADGSDNTTTHKTLTREMQLKVLRLFTFSTYHHTWSLVETLHRKLITRNWLQQQEITSTSMCMAATQIISTL